MLAVPIAGRPLVSRGRVANNASSADRSTWGGGGGVGTLIVGQRKLDSNGGQHGSHRWGTV